MAQTKAQIQSLLTQANMHPRHRFGQNFMIDQNLVRRVADAGQIAPGDVVIEVGPGTGTLTEELLSRGADVIAVEIDRDLAKLLRERFGADPSFTLIEGDALSSKHALNEELQHMLAATQHTLAATGSPQAGGARIASPLKLIANLPYNIASPLAIELLIAGVDLLAFTVQKEVADRLRAPAGSDAYGPLSVMAQLLATVEVLRTLPAQAFWPAPKIESALVRMRRDNKLGPRPRAGEVGRFVHQLFGFRRKTLQKAMRQAGYDPSGLTAPGLDPQARPEVLTPEQFLRLFEAASPAATPPSIPPSTPSPTPASPPSSSASSSPSSPPPSPPSSPASPAA